MSFDTLKDVIDKVSYCELILLFSYLHFVIIIGPLVLSPEDHSRATFFPWVVYQFLERKNSIPFFALLSKLNIAL